jgi:hypothetical protein
MEGEKCAVCFFQSTRGFDVQGLAPGACSLVYTERGMSIRKATCVERLLRLAISQYYSKEQVQCTPNGFTDHKHDLYND